MDMAGTDGLVGSIREVELFEGPHIVPLSSIGFIDPIFVSKSCIIKHESKRQGFRRYFPSGSALGPLVSSRSHKECSVVY